MLLQAFTIYRPIQEIRLLSAANYVLLLNSEENSWASICSLISSFQDVQGCLFIRLFKLFEELFFFLIKDVAYCLVFSLEIWKSLGLALEKPVLFHQQCHLMCLCVKSWVTATAWEDPKKLCLSGPALLTDMNGSSQSHSKVELLKPFQKPSPHHQHFAVQPKIPPYTQTCFENTCNFWLASVFGAPSIKHQWNLGSQCSPESLDGCVSDKQPKIMCIIKLVSRRFNTLLNSPTPKFL